MTRTFDIAIIGGGVIGLTLARALSRRGASLALFDAGAVIPPATNAAARTTCIPRTGFRTCS